MRRFQSRTRFEVLHLTVCKDLKLMKADLEASKEREVSAIIPDLISTLRDVLELVVPSQGPLEAQAILGNGLQAMELVDAKRFVLDNFLEGLKRGESPTVLVERYQGLGLLGKRPGTVSSATVPHDSDFAGDVLRGRGTLKRCSLALAQMVVNAVRSIPKFAQIESIITLFPPGIGFVLKGKGMSIHELFEVLKKPGRFSGMV